MWLKLHSRRIPLYGHGRVFRIRVWVLTIVWFCLLVLLFQRGIVGDWILRRGFPLALPRRVGHSFEISRVGIEHLSVVPERGLRVSVTPARVKSILRSASPAGWLVPAGIIRDGTAVYGKWLPKRSPASNSIPVTVCCNKSAGYSPKVVFRFPFSDFNQILRREMAEKWRDENEYFLGTYNFEQRIWFDSLSISSLPRPQPLPEAGATNLPTLRLNIRATGRLRYKVQDGVFKARITAKVQELSGTITLVPERHDDGVGFIYSCKVDKLKLAVKKMAPWLEKRLAQDLKHSIERSMNKRKRLKKFAQMRIPDWAPFDTVIDIKLLPKQTEMPSVQESHE